jgi:hypothetical protein
MPGTTSTFDRATGTRLPFEATKRMVTVPMARIGRRSLLATEMVRNGGLPSVMVVRSESEGTMCLVQPPSMIQAGAHLDGLRNRAWSSGMRQRASDVVMELTVARMADCRLARASDSQSEALRSS